MLLAEPRSLRPEPEVGPPPRTLFACLADKDLERSVLTFFEGCFFLLVAMVCSPLDSAESFSDQLIFSNHFDSSLFCHFKPSINASGSLS
jgi:hypothetical protein